MIDEVEALLLHWGEQSRRCSSAGGQCSPMASLMEWGGCVPRGTPGSRAPAGVTGPDAVTQALDVALADVGRQGKQGAKLEGLAFQRYRVEPTPTVREQMRLQDIAEGAYQTYFDRVHSLHLRLLKALEARADARKQSTIRPEGLPQLCANLASTLRRAG